MMSRNNEKWLILGGIAFAGAAVLTIEMIRRRKTDPLAQANKLIARCNDQLSQIEQSVAGLRTMVQAA
jgi:hypothetical protein